MNNLIKALFLICVTSIGVRSLKLLLPKPRVNSMTNNANKLSLNLINDKNAHFPSSKLSHMPSRTKLMVLADDADHLTIVTYYFYKVLPVISLFLSVAGLTYQIFVLYPWHEELSYELKDSAKLVLNLESEFARYDADKRTNLERVKDTYFIPRIKTVDKSSSPTVSEGM